ncbi:MAG: MATE family efflux transporter [Gammaproteobacteria bacterium]|nr:MATE family efflux transporter [Gammaproteobacteria bacterium]
MKSVNAAPKLLREPEGKTIRSLMVPMLLGMIAMIVYNLADIYFVSRLGTSALAALSFTFPVVFLIGAVTVGFGHGTSSVCARLYGAQKIEDVGRVTIHAILLALVTCAVLITVGLMTIDPLFRLLGADETTLAIINRYLKIYYFGLIFNVGPLIANPVLRAAGDARTPAMIMLLSAGLNITLDPILIFGLLGAPRMGMEGAAAATVIANFGTLVASVAAIRLRGNIVFPRSLSLDLLFDSWRRILQVGIPAMTSAAVAPVTTAIITYQVARFGQASVAGYGVASRIEGMVLLVLVALGTAVTPFVGQNFGAGRMDRVAKGISWCQRFSVAYGLSVAVLLAVIAPYVVRLFTGDEVAISTALMHMRIVPASYLAIGFALAASNSFNAIGKPMPGMIISLTRTILVYAPLAWLLSSVFGLVGIFAAACAANVIAGAVGLLWYRVIFAQLK